VLEKERESRYQSAGDLLLDLKRIKRQIESGSESARNMQLGSTNSEAIKQRRQSVGFWSAAAVLVAVGMAFGLYRWVSGPKTQTGIARVSPLTSYPGLERYPAFSPDGKQIAFAWNGENENNWDIYDELLGAGTPLRLTNNPATDWMPAWSPDGRFVAFVHWGQDKAGLFLIPSLGGPERTLLPIGSAAYIDLSAEAWSPDGKLIAYAASEAREQPLSIFLLSVDSLEKRKLTSPPPGTIGGDVSAAFSPDGKSLAFARGRDSDFRDIYFVPVAGGEPKRLTFDNRALYGLTWTPNGREIIFSSARGCRCGRWLWPPLILLPVQLTCWLNWD
jgi:Tol biopolymer transport system component